MSHGLRFDLYFPYCTPRFRLVPVEERHADLIWDWTRDPRFNEHTLWPQPRVPLQAKRLIDRALAQWDAGTAFNYFCEAKDTGEPLARLEARRSARRPQIGEVGMLIAPTAWNRGIASELTRFAMWFCFENLEVEAVAIDARPSNSAANHLLARLGLHALGEQDFPMPDGSGTVRLNRFVFTRDEFHVRMLPAMQDYALPAEVLAQGGEGMRTVEPVGEVGPVHTPATSPRAAANAELL